MKRILSAVAVAAIVLLTPTAAFATNCKHGTTTTTVKPTTATTVKKPCSTTTTTTKAATTSTTTAPRTTTTVNQLERNYGSDTIGTPVTTTVPAQVSAQTITTQPAAAKTLARTGPSHIKGLVELGIGLLFLGSMFVWGGYKTPIHVKGE